MFAGLIDKLQRREDLTVAEASAAMAEIMDGRAAPSQIAALLIALAMKGERPAEIVGLAEAMRARATRLSKTFHPVFDTCGTGGDRVAHLQRLDRGGAGGGRVRVCVSPNMAIDRCRASAAAPTCSKRSGCTSRRRRRWSNAASTRWASRSSLAPTFHPSMRHAAQTRKELGVRTAFNLLGPLTNPAGASRQLVGVPRPELTELVARALGLLGSERAWVVHGADGLDEISTTGYTKVSECRNGAVNTFYLHPSDVRLRKAAPAELRGGGPADNARIAGAILGGAPGAPRDIVLLNAGASLFIAGSAANLADGLQRAAEAIDSGRAADVLARLVRVSNAAPEVARA